MHRRVPVVPAVVALLALTLSGCGSSSGKADGASTTTTVASSTSTGASSTTAVAAAALPSKGCDAAAAATPVQLDKRTLPVADLTRWYLITIPAATTPAAPFPLVLDFHGLTEGADVHSHMSGFGDLATKDGFVAVIPQGTGDLARWAAGPGGDASAPNIDVDFVQAMLDQVEASVCIDTSRVYATGLSNGAMLTSLLACRMADRFAAVAPVAGATVFDSCEPAAVVPMLTFHGTADPILLFNGGVGDIVKLISGGKGGGKGGGTGGSTAPPTTTIPTDVNGPGYPANVKAWAERNGCGPTPTDTPVSGEITLRTYSCPAGADVEMYIITGGGHAWPGSEFSRNLASVIGPTTMDINATELIWQFFQRFRRMG